MSPDGTTTSHQLRMQRTTLADFGLFAFQCRNLDELLHRAAELVSNTLEIDLVKVLEHRPKQNDLLVRSGVNWQPGVVGHVTFADHAHSPACYALMTDEPVISRDVDRKDRFEIPEVLVGIGDVATFLENKAFGGASDRQGDPRTLSCGAAGGDRD